ncbi:RluA family pseudouridine synthase [Pelagibaculum spongiae]|uniref:RluA family pseudouridine synthase n=1 Tax=Pelagibaculum spongiae TaxID=2080658 RepID=A0A2V1H294_9GAMM|nr:RluA family pseudouridine synthase [Pelagibaculum spongiae]PVZ70562.1 RluA family pseudouridine synthase [Pelagibaculum spongiae]
MYHCQFPVSYQIFQSQRLIEFLTEQFNQVVEGTAEQWLSQSRVLVDQRLCREDLQLELGQQVTLKMLDHFEATTCNSWRKVWENEQLMVIDKPANLPVSRTTRNLFNTLIQLVRRQTPFRDAHLLHRLDAETSGLLVIAKNKRADKKYKSKIKRLITKKIYHAKVWGAPEWDVLDYRSILVEKAGSKIRSQVYSISQQTLDNDYDGVYLKPKKARTGFKVLKREDGYALIECALFTGRKHQIRAQLATLGYPIVGDKIYSFDGYYYLKRLERLEGALTEEDYEKLGARCHKLSAVKIKLVLKDDIFDFNLV